MTITQLLNHYVDFLKSNFTIKQLTNSVEINTPFLDSINDNISLYVDHQLNGQLLVNDDGYTLDNLQCMGLPLTPARQKLINQICTQFGIQIDQDRVLTISGQESEFPKMFQALLSAILHINDLIFTKKDQVKSIFVDDVMAYFHQQNFGGLPARLSGASGVDYNIQYAIPPKRNSPLKLVGIDNKLTTRHMMENAFRYSDIRSVQKCRALIVFNDRNKKESSEVQKIATAANIDLIPWSNKTLIESIM